MRQDENAKAPSELRTPAVIYARVACSEKGNVDQLYRQRRLCEQYANDCGYQILGAFCETGVPGNDTDRDQINAMLTCIKRQATCLKPVHVITDDLSRLARGPLAHVKVSNAIKEAGGVIEVPKSNCEKALAE